MSAIFWALIFLAILAALASTLGISAWDAWLVHRGILPHPNQTTLADIKKMRDNGQRLWALRRLRRLPEYANCSLNATRAALDAL